MAPSTSQELILQYTCRNGHLQGRRPSDDTLKPLWMGRNWFVSTRKPWSVRKCSSQWRTTRITIGVLLVSRWLFRTGTVYRWNQNAEVSKVIFLGANLEKLSFTGVVRINFCKRMEWNMTPQVQTRSRWNIFLVNYIWIIIILCVTEAHTDKWPESLWLMYFHNLFPFPILKG